jgi:DNA ligase D-like protein (predicted 3'-phosphoesterase)
VRTAAVRGRTAAAGREAAMAEGKLKEYRKKRSFGKTPEPKGGRAAKGKKPIFVIQKHNARSLHYDFRLEAGGVLKSWAVPKGPSTDPREKRLAVATEDHPLDYAGFEGVIPEGEYGAGTVIVWDQGTYRSLKEKDGKIVPVQDSVRDGHVMVWLDGRKLKGGYSLIRTGKGEDARWLLVKMKDGQADARRDPVGTEPESVLSGKTIEELAGGGGD